ncbi:CIS tube protein [Erwinia oleae]|uniref:CIS tube protein n=1 Tax=Erwinia oleae TaxID=796334 RepID=UPI000553DFF0|nr:hypothetical protein [Erwinia oleae]
MSLIERGLSKLTLSAWKDREGTISAGSLSAMYNPDSLQIDYQSRFDTTDAINKTTQSKRYVIAEPAGLTLNLLYDAMMPGNTTPIESQLAALKALCAVDAATDAPYFLKINWGKMRWENRGYFAGRASGLSINYSLFDRDATPLRATARLSLVADSSFVVQDAERQIQAPSSSIVSVPDLATLSLIAVNTGATLASGMDYLNLAWQNDMDNLDDFSAGQQITTSVSGEAT